MFKLFALLGLVAATLAAPQSFHGQPQFHQQGQIQIQPFSFGQPQPQPQLHSHQQVRTGASLQPTSLIPTINPVNFISAASPDGSSLNGFQTIDGQTREETIGADGSRRGKYTYPDASGNQVTVHYVADQHGYRSSNDPVSIALGSTAPRPTTTSTQAPPAAQTHHHNPLGGLFPASTLGHFGFQPLVQQQQPLVHHQQPLVHHHQQPFAG